MKVLNVTNIYFTLPYFFGNQLTYFSNKGYEIHLVCSPSNALEDFSNKHKCKFYEIEFSRNFSILADLKSLLKLIKYIYRNRFDIVTGHTPKAGMLAMLAARIIGVQNRIYFRHGLVYETAHGLKKTILLTCERIASYCASKVVCVSPYLIERSISDKLTSSNKLILLNKGSCTGLDVKNQFNPENINHDTILKLHKSLNINNDNFVIGFVGRIVKDKGVVELVKAFESVYAYDFNVRLLLIGPMEQRDAIPLNIIEIIESHPGIINVGLVETGLQNYYALMDLFVLPTHREGLGVALLEAQAMNIPVLTTSNTGAKDALISGETGDYIETNETSIVSKILEYKSDDSLRESRGKAGRRFVVDNFDERIIWKEIEKLYQDD